MKQNSDFSSAAAWLIVVVLMDVLFGTVAISTASSEQRVVSILVPVIGINVIYAALVVWIALGVKRGRRIMGGIGILMFILCAHGIAILLVLTGRYTGGPLLIVTHIGYVISIVVALGFLVRAQHRVDTVRRMNSE